MSGEFINAVNEGKEVRHYCRPGCVLTSVVGTTLEHLGPDVMLV